MQYRRRSMLPILLCASLSVMAIASPVGAEGAFQGRKKDAGFNLPTGTEPRPGETLDHFIKAYKGLHATGGVAIKGLAPGFSFEIWEGLRGKEASFSETFLPGDPTDAGALVYLPRMMLTVMRTPAGESYVIGESRAMAKPQTSVEAFLKANEDDALVRVPPAKGPLELLKRWYDRTVKNERLYQKLYAESGVLVYKAVLDGGTIESLVMVPDFDKALPESYAADAVPSGVFKRIDYLREYRRIALDDLWPVLFKPRRGAVR